MNGEKRRDLHRFLTAALAVTTAVLVILHFTGRDRVLKEAREDVGVVHDQARNIVSAQVSELRGRLEAWERDAAPPEGFTQVDVAGPSIPRGMRMVVPDPKKPAERVWVRTFSPDTDLAQEGDSLLEGKEFFVNLNFRGRGDGTLTLKAVLAGPPAPGQAPVPVEVRLRRGILPPEPLGREPLTAASATEAAPVTYTIRMDETVRTMRHSLVLLTPPGSPPVRVSWSVRVGDAQRGEVAMAIPRTFPERDVTVRVLRDGAFVEETARIGPEKVYVIGYAPLEDFARRIREAGLLETERWGDRLYLTDESGTVAEAIPDYPEKIRQRVKAEGRTSLASLATQRVKVRTAATDEYEGFARDRVVGAFGPLGPINGGLIVEREERKVLAAFRGAQTWHVSAGLFGLLLLIPLVPPVVRRIREDTELPRLMSYAKVYLPHMGAILAAATLASAGKAVYGFLVKVVTDDVILSSESTAYARLEEICWILAAVAVGMFAANWVKEYLGKYIQNRVVVDLRCTLCEKIVHLPMSFHSRQRAGDLLSRIQNDVAETNRGLEMLFGEIITDPITILGLVATAFAINWRLALVVFVGLPVILVPISYFGQKIKKHARRRQAKKADVTHTINQMLSGIRVVKAFRMEDHEAKRIRSVSQNFLAEAMRVARSQVTSKESLEFFSNLSSVVILALGGYLVLEKQVTVGDLMAFVFLIGNMYRSSKNLTSNYNKMQESLAGTERIFEVLDTPDSMADRPAARALVRPRESIAFERVSFRYADDGPFILKDIDLRIPVGTSVALVGATGAGKSTLLDLVARFYDPTEGRVAIDGVDLRDFSRTSLLSQVAVVTQEAFLFNASIAENLRYGRPGASQTELEAAARAAFIHDEILRQPEGYETVVGERGSRLSGGQRQRLTIARAILKDPPILLLDEATSALDSGAEKVVQDALSNLMKDRTTFVIAHRLSTIQGVDRILVMDGGRVVEQGTHEELIRVPRGVYRRLYEIQFAVALDAVEGDGPADAGAAAG